MQQEQLEFFTPVGVTAGNTELLNARMRTAPRVQELAGKLASTFSETDVILFKAGEPSLTIGATGKQDLFREEIARVLNIHLDGIVSPEGKILNNDEWTNIQEVAPALIQILLNRTENHVQAVSRLQAVNVIAFAVDVARNPELLGDTVLLTAFGGSSDEHASMRLPAYPLSVVHIHHAMQEFYGKRATTAITRAQRVKLYQQEILRATNKKGSELERDEKKELDARLDLQLTNGTITLPTLTSDELQVVLQRKAIPTKFPTIHLTYAHNAAAEVNTRALPEDARRKKRTAIASRTRDNRTILENTVRLYENVAPYVQLIEDIPWDNQPLLTRMHIGYMARILSQAELNLHGDYSVQEALKRLQEAGKTHNGEEGYLEYAAAHPAIFLDAYHLPFAPTLEGVIKPPLAVITVGGEPEQDFHAVRHYLSTHANIYGFLGYLIEQKEHVTSSGERKALDNLIEEARRWDNTQRFSPTQHTIHLSTSIGKYPVYYFRDGVDKPHGSISLDSHIAELEIQLAAVAAKTPHNQASALTFLAERSELEHVLTDLYALQRSQRRATR